jgi:hypothetical protein
MRHSHFSRARDRARRFVPRLEALEERTLLSIAPAFAPPINTATGQAPLAVAVADFNHDGHLDVAVANAKGSGGISLLFGNSQGGFTPAPGSPLLPNTYVTDVVAADLNGDSYADLAVVSPTGNNLTVLLNDHSGGFTKAPGSPFDMGGGTYPASLAVGDFNGDGIPDLLVAQSQANAVLLLRGQGDGSFAVSTLRFTNFGGPEFLAVGDFNNDGKLDYAVTQAGNEVSMIAGDGKGGFDNETDVALPSLPGGVAVGDFNYDGNLDVAVATPQDNTVHVLEGNGKGHFPQDFVIPAGTAPHRVAVADVNSDTRPDLVVTGPQGVTVLLGEGQFGFTLVAGSPFPVGATPAGVAVGDFNGDGVLDVVAANRDSNNISVLLNEAGDRTTLTASANPVAVNQPVTITATVSPTVPGSGVPGGIIAFRDGETLLALVPLNSAGQASLTLPTLALGNHSFSAQFFGSQAFLPTDSNVLSETVSPVGDVTSRLSVTLGQVIRHKRQTVTLKNTGSLALVGPFRLVLDNLSPGVKLLKPGGRKHKLAPVRSPFMPINTLVLDPGQSVSLTLQFANPRKRGIHYTPRVVSGLSSI